MNTLKKIEEWGVRWVVIDLETPGLDPVKHGALEIGAKLDTGETFELECRPHGDMADVEPEALEVNGYRRMRGEGVEFLISASEAEEKRSPAEHYFHFFKKPTQREAVAKLLGWLMRMNPSGRWTLVGRCPKFDLKLMQEISGLTYRVIDPEPIDLHDLVRAELVRMGVRPARFVTNERYELLGFATEKFPHRGLQGAEDEWEVAQRFLGGEY